MTHESQLDLTFLQQIANKVNQIESKVQQLSGQTGIKNFGTNFKNMYSSTKNIVSKSINNSSYLNSTQLFYDDFLKSIYTINEAIDSYLGALNSIKSPKDDLDLIYILDKDIENFSKSILIFSSILDDIFTCHSKLKGMNQEAINNNNNNNIRLGLESVLFNLSVKVQPVTEYPFFKSNFIEIYHFYNQINNMTKPITAIQSYCGTGKTLCVPIILMCRSLRDKMNFPFLILSQPSPKHVDSKEKFFIQKVGKYVTVLSDSDKLLEIFNGDENNKLVLGLFAHYTLLPFLYKLRKNQKFYQKTRFIVDELHQRTIYLDVLISKIATLSNDVFKLPMHVTLMSASFSPEIIKPFKNQIEMNQLVKHSLYEINENYPIIEKNIYKINNVIVPEEVANVMNEMSRINSSIEEGNILCFLSGIGNCNKVKKSIYSMIRKSEETKNYRKIIILQTTIKPKESLDNYFQRLKSEFELNEGLREAKKYRYNFLYFIPLVLSGITEDTVYKLTQEEFPDELKNINKFICSTPMLQSSFAIDKLSAVIDSGLSKEAEFDIFTGLTTLKEKQVSLEVMNQRKGRLGRTMKGLYVQISSPLYLIPKYQSSPIEKVDLTSHILYLKSIGIDIEKLKNLPSSPDESILDFTLDNLIEIGLLDPKNYEITQLGRETLKYPFISPYYAASVLKYKDSFNKEERPLAQFIAIYISLVITMDSILVQEDYSEKLSRFFREDSDIVTLINALNSLILSDVTDDNERRDLVESYGFSYSSFLVFLDHMKTTANLLLPGKTIPEVIHLLGGFVRKMEGVSVIIDNFILVLCDVFPHWKKIHSLEMKYVSGAGSFESRPSLVFEANDRLKFENQRQPKAEVRISSRPGWNGIIIPNECYCFNISRNLNSNINIGRLVHRKSKKANSCITSVECDKSALNPWFDVLLSSYFSFGRYMGIRYFTNYTGKKNGSKSEYNKRMFHISNVEERVFISFMPETSYVKDKIVEGINKCILLLPYTPRSIVVYRKDINSLVEIKSIGSQHYETAVLQNEYFMALSAFNIHYCLDNLSDLAKSNSKIRIGAVFTNGSCTLDSYNQKALYLIFPSDYPLNLMQLYSSSYLEHLVNFKINDDDDINDESDLENIKNSSSEGDELELFQFPPKFIHPALLYNHESFNCIMKWFKNYCDYAHVVKVIGHRFLIKSSEINELQNHIRLDKELILKQMNLNLVAIPVPKKVYQKAYLIIKDHQTWNYNSRFKVIITSKEEENEVRTFLDQIKKENETENDQKQEKYDETLCCLYICEDPEDPVLTKYPITIYNKDGTRYTNKMCRDCLYSSLEIATESFYSNGKINQEALQNISIKPSVIPSVESDETEDGLECWPQIPLGQMISALINNDEEMSALVTAWLVGVVEFTLRTQCKYLFSFCPDHPNRLYCINDFDKFDRFCKVPSCRNIYCPFCKSWHNEKFICEEKKNGKPMIMSKMCPKCKTPTFKDGGCNHITCPCGCHWCYKCGKGFRTSGECYKHLSTVHGGCFDYNFE